MNEKPQETNEKIKNTIEEYVPFRKQNVFMEDFLIVLFNGFAILIQRERKPYFVKFKKNSFGGEVKLSHIFEIIIQSPEFGRSRKR